MCPLAIVLFSAIFVCRRVRPNHIAAFTRHVSYFLRGRLSSRAIESRAKNDAAAGSNENGVNFLKLLECL